MTTHPIWYYRQYGKVFGRGAGYQQDVETIASVTRLSESVVLEIGAGTGEHAACLLETRPAFLDLIDYDEDAASLLRHRFAGNEKVNVSCEDGFASNHVARYDVVIAMYSIITQGLESVERLTSRIHAIKSKLAPGGTALFEWIDRDVSEVVYPNEQRTVLYENGSDHVEIFSQYDHDRLIISYEGILGGNRLEYRVPMLSVNRALIENVLAKIAAVDGSGVGIRPLDPTQRRMLAYITRPR